MLSRTNCFNHFKTVNQLVMYHYADGLSFLSLTSVISTFSQFLLFLLIQGLKAAGSCCVNVAFSICFPSWRYHNTRSIHGVDGLSFSSLSKNLFHTWSLTGCELKELYKVFVVSTRLREKTYTGLENSQGFFFFNGSRIVFCSSLKVFFLPCALHQAGGSRSRVCGK